MPGIVWAIYILTHSIFTTTMRLFADGETEAQASGMFCLRTHSRLAQSDRHSGSFSPSLYHHVEVFLHICQSS